MRPKVALLIGAVAAGIFGSLLVFAPGSMLAGFGLGAPVEGIVLARDVGAALLAFALLNWLARGSSGSGLVAILTANLFLQALELVVNGWELARGELPAAAAPGLAIHLVLGIVFALAIWRPTKTF